MIKYIVLPLLISLCSLAHADQYDFIDLKEDLGQAQKFCDKYKSSNLEHLPLCSISVDGVDGLFQTSVSTGNLNWIYTQYHTIDKTRILSLFEKVVSGAYALYGPPTKKYDQYHIIWKKYNVTISLERIENKTYYIIISQYSGSL